MLSGLIILFAFTLLGNIATTALQLSVPGAVTGLLALLVYLRLRGGPSASLSKTADTLIRFMPALLIPPGVGMFFLGDILKGQWLPLGLAILPGTLLSLMLTAAVMQRCIHHYNNPGHNPSSDYQSKDEA